MRRTGLIAAAALMLSAWTTGARAGDDAAPLQVYGNLQTIELAPVLYAAEEFSPIAVEVKMGGIPNLVGEAGAQGFASPGVADLATNAETQLLRYSVRHPDLRIISWYFNGSSGLSVVAIALIRKRSNKARGLNSGVRKASSIRSK